MKVQDVMAKAVAPAAPMRIWLLPPALMWEHNCGQPPVVDDQGKVSAVITDRDICIALGTRNQRACEIKVRDVTCRAAVLCQADDHSACRAEDHGRGASAAASGGQPGGNLGGDPVPGRRYAAGAAPWRQRPASGFFRRRDEYAVCELSRGSQSEVNMPAAA